MPKATSSTIALFAVLTLPIPRAQTQTVTLVTNENWAELHARYRPEFSSVTEATTTNPNLVQIGVFYPIMHLDGESFYEFDWFYFIGNGPCPGSGCQKYTGPITFVNAIVYANGTSSSWASSGQGPINTGEGYGIVFGTDSETPFSNCNPLTYKWLAKVVDGDPISAYQSNCIDIALQLVSYDYTNTFTLLNGKSVTTYGISNTFITPLAGEADVFTICDPNDFCGYQAVFPVYMQRYPN
jgi:hypothetical protein